MKLCEVVGDVDGAFSEFMMIDSDVSLTSEPVSLLPTLKLGWQGLFWNQVHGSLYLWPSANQEPPDQIDLIRYWELQAFQAPNTQTCSYWQLNGEKVLGKKSILFSKQILSTLALSYDNANI